MYTLNHTQYSSKSVEELAHQWVSNNNPPPDPFFLSGKQRALFPRLSEQVNHIVLVQFVHSGLMAVVCLCIDPSKSAHLGKESR